MQRQGQAASHASAPSPRAEWRTATGSAILMTRPFFGSAVGFVPPRPAAPATGKSCGVCQSLGVDHIELLRVGEVDCAHNIQCRPVDEAKADDLEQRTGAQEPKH